MPYKFVLPLLFAASVAAAADVYTIPTFVIAPGGVGVSTSACFSLSGAVGQPLVDTSVSANYTVVSGFWATVPPPVDSIFSNGFESCNS